MDLSRVINPYDFSNPVSDTLLLVGRQQEMQEIRYYLAHAKAAPRPMHIALLGRRASGKTSLLNITEIEAKRLGFCTARINLDEGDVRTILSFFFKLFDAVLSSALELGAFGGVKSKTYDTSLDMVGAYHVPDDKTFVPFVFPVHYAKAMAAGSADAPLLDHMYASDLGKIRQEVERPIAILFDEGNVLAQSRVHLEKLRNLFMNLPGFMLVLTGTPELFPVMDEVFSPMVRQFKKIVVGAFRKVAQTRECIVAPLRRIDLPKAQIDNLILPPDVFEIHRLSGGEPYQIQLACHILFRRVQEKRAKGFSLDVGVLDEILRELEVSQKLSQRSVLQKLRALSKNELRAFHWFEVGGEPTLDQLWAVEYLLHGESEWNKSELEEVLSRLRELELFKVEEGRIKFNGSDFEAIYARYLAIEREISGFFGDFSLEFLFRSRMRDYVEDNIGLEQLGPFMEESTAYDPQRVYEELAKVESEEDPFVKYPGMAFDIYFQLARYQGLEKMDYLEVLFKTSWLSATFYYCASLPKDVDKLESAVNLFAGMSERTVKVGAEFRWKVLSLPILQIEQLIEKVKASGNEELRDRIIRLHYINAANNYFEGADASVCLKEVKIAQLYSAPREPNVLNIAGYLSYAAGSIQEAEQFFAEGLRQWEGLSGEERERWEGTAALLEYNLGTVAGSKGEILAARDWFTLSINRLEQLAAKEVKEEVGCLFVPKVQDGKLMFIEKRESAANLLDLARIALEESSRICS